MRLRCCAPCAATSTSPGRRRHARSRAELPHRRGARAQRAPSRGEKGKQIGSDRFKLTTWPGYQLISDNAKRTWGKTLPSEWFCEAHGPSVFKAILTGDPYQIRGLICNATNPVNSYGDAKMTLAALKKVEFLVTVDYWMTPTALFSDYVFPAAGALERPIIVTHYGATDSVMGGRRAIQPKYDRHDDFTFWRKLGIACGQDEADWPWETIEEAYSAIIAPLGLPVANWDEFVEMVRMYYPPLHQKKYESNGGFWTPSGKVECNSSILRELGYAGMPTYIGAIENPIDTPELLDEYPLVLTTGGGFMPYHHPSTSRCRASASCTPIRTSPSTRDGGEDGHRLRRLVLDRDPSRPHQDARERRARGRSSRDLRTARLVVPSSVTAPPTSTTRSAASSPTSTFSPRSMPSIATRWVARGANRGLLCKVYKCTELDHDYKPADTQFSIPGSVAEPGIHVMPSEGEALPREDPVREARAHQGSPRGLLLGVAERRAVPEGHSLQAR